MAMQTKNSRQTVKTPKKKPKQLASESKITSFSDHIGELRRRIFIVALLFIIASGLAYNYNDFFVKLIMQPLNGQKLIYLTPGGGFNFIFQISLYVGLLVAAPALMYQLYGFIKPALPSRARRSAIKVVSAAFLLMVCGVCFGYFVAIPSALKFLSTFAGTDVIPNLTADSYLGFFLAYIAGLGVLFELPLLLLFIHWIHPMTPKGLLKTERFVILFAFIIAALITPTPDAFNQSMIAVPLILIYQGGVITVWLAIRRERKREKQPVVQEMVSNERSTVNILKPLPVPVPVEPEREMPVFNKVAKIGPVRRSMDGFSRSPRGAVTVPPRRVSPPQTTPKRPAQVNGTTYRRLGIDGFPLPNN